MPVGNIESQPQQILDLFKNLGGFYDTDPQAQQLQNFFQTGPGLTLQNQLEARAGGTDVPFTPGIIQNLLGANADAFGGQVARESDLIRSRLGRTGQGGTGQEASALLTSQARAGRGLRAGRQDIFNRSQLENFRERVAGQRAVQQLQAQKLQAQQFLTQQRFGAQSQATQGAADFRQRLQEIQNQRFQDQQQQRGQQNFMNRVNILSNQAHQPTAPGFGGWRDPYGQVRGAGRRESAATQLNALIATGGGAF